jgi:hypothetical protein
LLPLSLPCRQLSLLRHPHARDQFAYAIHRRPATICLHDLERGDHAFIAPQRNRLLEFGELLRNEYFYLAETRELLGFVNVCTEGSKFTRHLGSGQRVRT